MLLTNVVTLWCRLICIEKNLSLLPDLTAVHVVRVIEQCCFNSVSDLLIDSITFGGFKMEGSGTLLKQHCSITLRQH